MDNVDMYQIPKGNNWKETKIIFNREYKTVHTAIEGKAFTKKLQPIPNRLENQE